MPRKKRQIKIAVLDCETDPFVNGRVPKPFAVEFYCDDMTIVHWGDDCIDKLMADLSDTEHEYMIYAHNGGKFDFFMMLDSVDEGTPKIINGRLVSHTILNAKQIIRDSYAILPVPLAASKQRKAKWERQMKELFGHDDMTENKEAFYHLFERETREDYKRMILDYMHDDCLDLYEMVVAFNNEFGPKMTIGGTAIKELLKRHPVARMTQEQDRFYRQWYFGGRVQCFDTGIVEGPWKVYDRISSYPATMRDVLHPFNARYHITDKLPDSFDKPFFAIIDAVNRNALPWRESRERLDTSIDYGSIDFARKSGTFFVTNHELEAALEIGAVDVLKVHEVHIAEEYGTFADFINHFYQKRQEAASRGDEVYKLLWKLVMNSAYGKFGQDPENYSDWYLTRGEIPAAELIGKGYSQWHEYPHYELWSKPARIHSKSYYDVSIAASITSAARAALMRAIASAVDPIYCDTDSVICRAFNGDVDKNRLGAWKLEAEATHAAIAGKKLYALYNGDVTGKPVKLASKGVRLTLPQIIDVCEGGEVEYKNKAPTYSWRVKKDEPSFVKRRVRMTA